MVKHIRKPRSIRFSHRRRRSALTLLEVIVSLALAAVLMVAVGFAIDIHLRVMTIKRVNIEQAQLARALMGLIAKDLRNAVYLEPSESSSATISSSSSTEENSEEGSGGSSEESGEEEALVEEPLPSVPGIYGNISEIQIDVSRVPRLDEYQTLLSSNGELTEIPSDVKTVAYYLSAYDSQNSESVVQIAERGDVGFFRRTLDRAATLWAMQTGNFTALDNKGDLLATEVTALEFNYYDGTEWFDEWDSELRGGVPIAVQISIAIATSNDQDTREGLTASLFNYTQVSVTDTVYQLVVSLPAAQPDKIKTDTSVLGSTTDSESTEGSTL